MKKKKKSSNTYFIRNILPIIITIVFGLLMYYIFLPPLNIHSFAFWFYVVMLLLVYFISSVISKIEKNKVIVVNEINNPSKVIFGLILLIIFGGIIVNVCVSPIFNSKSYSKRITINEDTTFTEDVKEVDFKKIPLLDKESSQKLGDRVMGEMPELVSQFDVSDLYTQINYNDEITRVTPLEYSGIIKYFSNRKDGVKGYIKVNSVDGKTELVKLDKGMKYMPSAMFNENLNRKLRFSYPTEIFGTPSFEIDNEGNPYWIVPTVTYSGIGMKERVTGIVALDPITGKSNKYNLENIPTWIDHVYNADLIIEQVDDWGKYRNGFFNSLFGQKNVVATTEGYNYMVMDDDVYLYTGITSILADEANIGFILTNMRTRETHYYAVPGAEEFSAMSSAEGQVQQMEYRSTFPLLINLNGKPTYLVSLKDNAGLVKMYGFIDVQNYQNVVVTDYQDGIEKAAKNYLNSYKEDEETPKEELEKDVTISNLKTVIIDGNTYYYFESDKQKYRVSIKVNPELLPYLSNNDKVSIKYREEKDLIEVSDIKTK